MSDDDWYLPYMPTPREKMQDYVDRLLAMDEFQNEWMHFVMMEHDADDLAIIGRAHQLLATRHKFSPGEYCVFAIRDLVFCAYTPQWSSK